MLRTMTTLLIAVVVVLCSMMMVQSKLAFSPLTLKNTSHQLEIMVRLNKLLHGSSTPAEMGPCQKISDSTQAQLLCEYYNNY
jgi:hypothetical protein